MPGTIYEGIIRYNLVFITAQARGKNIMSRS